MKLRIDIDKLKAFVDDIDDFESKYSMKQVLLLAYYLQKEEGVKYFEDYDIQDCYDVLEIDSPQNIDGMLYNAKEEGTLVTRLDGYKFSKAGWNQLSDELGQIHQVNEKVYQAGDAFYLYKDITSLLSTASHEVFVIDPYVNEEVIELYFAKLPTGVKMMLLAKQHQDNFLTVARKFKLKHQANFVVRINDKCHDRALFIDKMCYVIGQSLKDAAVEKPTYLKKMENVGALRNECQSLFDAGTTLL